jgi:hypothetical protein
MDAVEPLIVAQHAGEMGYVFWLAVWVDGVELQLIPCVEPRCVELHPCWFEGIVGCEVAVGEWQRCEPRRVE